MSIKLTNKQKTEILLKKMYITITSVEVAEMTGKRHDSVLRDIQQIIQEMSWEEQKITPNLPVDQILEIDTFYNTTYKDKQGKERSLVVMGERFGMVLLAGYSVEYRVALIDELRERRRVANIYLEDYQDYITDLKRGIKISTGNNVQPCTPEDVREMLQDIKANEVSIRSGQDYYENFLKRNAEAKHDNQVDRDLPQQARVIIKKINTENPLVDVGELFNEKITKNPCRGGFTLLLGEVSIGRYNKKKKLFTLNARGLKILNG